MTILDAELDIYVLPHGARWCDAGCNQIGEHNGQPCITCGGKGFQMAVPNTPACPVVGPPTGVGQAGPKPPAVAATALDVVLLPGLVTPAGSCDIPSNQLPAGTQSGEYRMPILFARSLYLALARWVRYGHRGRCHRANGRPSWSEVAMEHFLRDIRP